MVDSLRATGASEIPMLRSVRVAKKQSYFIELFILTKFTVVFWIKII